jgi:CDP-diacylglycerol pyrophosphatase
MPSKVEYSLKAMDVSCAAARRAAPSAASGGHTARAKPRSIALAALAVLLAASLAAPACTMRAGHDTVEDPDALWKLVDDCIDRTSAGYCSCPELARSCCGDPETPDADVVWAVAPDFVAIRDLEMCGCPAGFVAGLALPRTRVTGIEDPRRPDGIWPFAWRVARSRIGEERDIGLVVNPVDARTQDELHVHLLRLQPSVRAVLDAEPPSPPAGTLALPLATLDGVFTAVAAHVGPERMGEHGILVARLAGGFVALITERRSPQDMTIDECRRTR